MLRACSSSTRASTAAVCGRPAPHGAAEARLQLLATAVLPARPHTPSSVHLPPATHIQWPGLPPRHKYTQLPIRQIIVSRLPAGETSRHNTVWRSSAEPTLGHSCCAQSTQSFQDSAVLGITPLSSSTSSLYSHQHFLSARDYRWLFTFLRKWVFFFFVLLL